MKLWDAMLCRDGPDDVDVEKKMDAILQGNEKKDRTTDGEKEVGNA